MADSATWAGRCRQTVGRGLECGILPSPTGGTRAEHSD